MRPGEGEVILILDTQREVKALEDGIVSAGLAETDFERELFNASYEADYHDPRFDGKHNAPPWKRAIEPELEVTHDNVDQVRAAAEATIAQKGLISALVGRRHVAEKIIRNI